MHRLKPTVQPYAWGKTGPHSEVANLYKAGADPEFNIEPSQAYAELWMGTHPKSPSTIYKTGEPLPEWLAANKAVLGDKLASRICAGEPTDVVNLPLLFKVLSVSKALSIQVHPTKEQAIQLHATDPSNYPDPNHKPEISIALTPFEMLCGFQTLNAIYNNIVETPELFELIGGEAFEALKKANDDSAKGVENTNEARAALKQCFHRLVTQPSVVVERNVRSLTERCALRIKSQQDRGVLAKDDAYVLAELFIRLNYHYPGDIGVFAPLFLNHFILEPGEACFLAPNEPHAYLFGDCIECMATSDNTIRAGLTPKYKDVPTLCASMTYRMADPTANKFSPTQHPNDSSVTVYGPPVPEFVVHKIEVRSIGAYSLMALKTCSILIVISGAATSEKLSSDEPITRGQVFLISADNQSENLTITEAPFIAFRAFTDESMLGML